jgi:hypothetical protein
MRRLELAAILCGGLGLVIGCTQSTAPAPSALKGAATTESTVADGQTGLTGRTNSFAVLAVPGKSVARNS